MTTMKSVALGAAALVALAARLGPAVATTIAIADEGLNGLLDAHQCMSASMASRREGLANPLAEHAAVAAAGRR